MAKRESTFINMLMALTLVTLVAAGSLGGVYNLTKDAIAEAKLKAQNEAISKVLPPFDELKETRSEERRGGKECICGWSAVD